MDRLVQVFFPGCTDKKFALLDSQPPESLKITCSSDEIEIVKEYLQDKSKDARLDSLVREAATNGNQELIELLLQHGVDLSLRGKNSPIFLAAKYGNVEVVDLLFKDARVENSVNIDDLFVRAVEGGHLEVIKFLKERGVDKETTLHRALYLAVKKSRKDIVKYLLKDENFATSLCFPGPIVSDAVFKNDAEIVELLLEHGADPNGCYPINHAAERGCTEIAELLLKYGANPEDNHWGSPLHNAAKNGHYKIVMMLLVAKQAREYQRTGKITRFYDGDFSPLLSVKGIYSVFRSLFGRNEEAKIIACKYQTEKSNPVPDWLGGDYGF